MNDTLCPICGAYSSRQCEMLKDAGICPWEESEPDPDRMRDDRDERVRANKFFLSGYEDIDD